MAEPFSQMSAHLPCSRERVTQPFTLPPIVTFLECAQCGFEPDDQLRISQRCPKCQGYAWRRSPRPGGLLGAMPDSDQPELRSSRQYSERMRRAG